MTGAERTEHNLILNSRSKAVLDGVTGVISFDDKTVAMTTVLGELSVDGESLNIVKLELDEGKLVIEGRICGIFYSEPDTKPSGKRKLFR